MNDQYIDLKELATRLSLSVRTLRSWVRDATDPLPAYRVRGKLLFVWTDVVAWVERHRVQPVDVESMATKIMDDLIKEIGHGRTKEAKGL
jgi:excisionase family DNA binding protein